MKDIIIGMRVPEFEEACNEEAHQDQTQQGTQQVLGGSAPPSLPLPPSTPIGTASTGMNYCASTTITTATATAIPIGIAFVGTN